MPAQGTPDFYSMEMLGNILSKGQSSRMYKAIVDEEQTALAVGAFPFPSEDPGLYLVFGIANVGVEVSDLENSINNQISRMQDELVSEHEFQKIRNQVENTFISRNSRVVGIAENLANYYVYFGDANLINTEIDRFMDVTREDIQRVAGAYLVPNNRVVLHYLPKSAQKKPEEKNIKNDN